MTSRRARLVAAVLAVSSFGALSGCERSRDVTPVPPVSTSAVQLPAPTSVPAAPSAGAPSKPDESARDLGRQQADAKGTLTKEEESKSMPLAGQVNNHSSGADTTTAAPVSK